MSKKGLKPNSERTPEELRENGRKGGLKAAASRRRAKELRTLLNDFLSTPVAIADPIPDKIIPALKEAGYKDITLKERGALLLAWKMSLGDIRAGLLVAKMIGEYTEEISGEDMEEEVPQAIQIVVTSEAEAADLAELSNLEV